MAITVLQPDQTEVDELDPVQVLAGLADAEAAERRAALLKLELALRWCVLHPATLDTGAVVWGDAGLPGLEDCDQDLGGEGCPRVAAFAADPFAAALGVSTVTGMQLLADALDLATGCRGRGRGCDSWRWRPGRPGGWPRPPITCPHRQPPTSTTGSRTGWTPAARC